MKDYLSEGGPAFPSVRSVDTTNLCPGMTLRDYFAGQALQAAARITEGYMPVQNARFQHSVAAQAYKMADAMIELRIGRAEGEQQ